MPIHSRLEEGMITARSLQSRSTQFLNNLHIKCNQWFENFTKFNTDIHGNKLERLCKASKGKPFVFDDGIMRSLHFDVRTIQSAMWISAPDELAFGYTRCMTAFLLQNPSPSHILIIGLGGGSLVKFCYKYLPKTRITVLEIDQNIIALRDQFFIPADDDRLKVIHVDAVDYVEKAPDDVDVILLDGFDADGAVSSLMTETFYSECNHILTPTGMLVSNMWGEPKELSRNLAKLSISFDNAIQWARSIDSYNIISFAFKSSMHTFSNDLTVSASKIDDVLGLELETLMSRLQFLKNDAFLRSKRLSASNPDSLSENLFAQIAKKIHAMMIKEAVISRTRLAWFTPPD